MKLKKFKTKKSWLKGGGNPGDICLFKVKNGNTRLMCETLSKITINLAERRH